MTYEDFLPVSGGDFSVEPWRRKSTELFSALRSPHLGQALGDRVADEMALALYPQEASIAQCLRDLRRPANLRPVGDMREIGVRNGI